MIYPYELLLYLNPANMKKIILSSFLVFIVSAFAFAQRGNNQIGIGAELDIPLGSFGDAYNMGFGVNVKPMLGIGTSTDQVTFTTGYSTFSGKSGTYYANQNFSMVPILFGYRHLFHSGFYLEPQLGLTSNTTKAGSIKYQETKFAAALNAGYSTPMGLDASIRYHTEGDVLSMLALRLAYNIRLRK